MKNFLIFALCTALIIGGAFGFSEFFYGSTGIMKSGIVDVTGVDIFEGIGKVSVLDDPEGETEEKIIEILSKAERKNIRLLPKEPIEGDLTDYEIGLYFMDIYEQYFVYLGSKSSVYHPESGKSWEITNADEIIAELDALFAE